MPSAQPSLQVIFGKALAAYQTGRFAEAEQLCRLVVAGMPKLFDARFLMGLIQSGLGRHRQALENFDKALAIRPRSPEVLAAKAASEQALGRFAAALAAYDAALLAQPRSPELAYNRATVLEALGRPEQALAGYDAALALRDDFLEALHNRATLLHAAGRSAEALTDYDRALALRPGHAPLLHNRARLLRDLARYEEALADLDRALAAAPGRPDLLNSRGLVLLAAGRTEDAVDVFARGLAISASDGALRLNKAKAELSLGLAEAALATLAAAPPGEGRAPELVGVKVAALYEMERYEAALAASEEGLAASPDHPGLLTDRANALRECGRLAEALAAYDAALKRDPAHRAARYGRATLLLFMGRFAEGWPGFEERRITSVWRPRGAKTPQWDGSPLAGRRLLLHSEQGLGDTLHFVRFAQCLANAAAPPIVEVQPSLRALLATMPGLDVRALADPPPPHDVHAPLMSLPALLGIGDALGAERVPYLSVDPRHVAAWRDRLPRDGFRIGIAWQGNPKAAVDRLRSVPLAAFAPVARLAGVTLISLQKGAGTEQLDDIPPAMQVMRLGDDFAAGADSFLDTAAVIENLDCVISIDSAIAHLAGALGRPLIVALKAVPEWRWGPSGDRSPWYPSARLFRQSRRGDWVELFERIAAAVAARRDGVGM